MTVAIKGPNDLTNKLFSALNLQIFCGRLASVRDFLVFNALSLVQAGQTGLLDGRNVNEDVFPAALGLDESVAFCWIEPLHRAACHWWSAEVERLRIADEGANSNVCLG